MKLVSLYSNNAEIFPRIEFREGLNVVFARVQDPHQQDRDSHNLGKTFLIEVIDFVLLKEIDKSHPFRKFPALFNDFIFFLQILSPAGKWITVRRAVQGRNPCALTISDESIESADLLPADAWTSPALPLRKAEQQLQSALSLTAVEPYHYRKGLGYILRRQGDWDEVFWLDRFKRGRDKDWKPYVGKVLGFDPGPILEKYEIEDQITALENLLAALEQEAGSRSSEYGRVKGLIELKQAAVAQQINELNSFSFAELEAEASERGVRVIESDIARLNERRYTIDYELAEIAKSLATELPFDIERIEQVFAEANIAFPSALMRSYQDLLEFNRRLSTRRTDRLHSLREKLATERENIVSALERLDHERQETLRLINERETFQKYIRLQAAVRTQESEIAELQRRLDKLDVAATTQRQIDELELRVKAVSDQIRTAVRQGNPTLTHVRRRFSENVQRVLNVPALLSVTLNESGNLAFDVQTLDRAVAERETSEAEGTSYRKMLCAAYDLAVLSAHAQDHFYRFVFHDGVLEGLDNRKKVSYLTLVRNLCAESHIQYILTIIDSDLPRNESDEKLLFDPSEIVRELHDQGDSGRLFRMPAF